MNSYVPPSFHHIYLLVLAVGYKCWSKLSYQLKCNKDNNLHYICRPYLKNLS